MSGVGGDMSEMLVCPMCGSEVINTRWPRHVHGEDCESDESGAQSDLSAWGGDA